MDSQKLYFLCSAPHRYPKPEQKMPCYCPHFSFHPPVVPLGKRAVCCLLLTLHLPCTILCKLNSSLLPVLYKSMLSRQKKNPLCFLVNFFFTLRFPLWTLYQSQRSTLRGAGNRQWLSCKLVLMPDWSGSLPREPLLIARMKVSGSFASLAWGLSWQKCKDFVALD